MRELLSITAKSFTDMGFFSQKYYTFIDTKEMHRGLKLITKSRKFVGGRSCKKYRLTE